ncbi:hypothetical protein [Defluviitalea raffinosedens]|uniref:hypothetical protein n=1 Tax=Defluviitalea raffinosedens TaxID=1450156 RepID=UPI001958BB25|nr:hypothetical protein [Defluviitalea raffinosedens]MBM7684787.1 hypothetical protein [Defluviitalea raffinosedens]
MGASINYEGLITQIEKCCLTEEVCGECTKENCLVGYCKKCLITCLKSNDEFLDDGMDHIPYDDTKVYDDEAIVRALGFILHQCKNCNVYHDEACIINIIRSAFEVILLGESLEYKGSTFLYLNDIKNINEEYADRILNVFDQYKEGA